MQQAGSPIGTSGTLENKHKSTGNRTIQVEDDEYLSRKKTCRRERRL
jgi:hypothetical protein